MTTHRRSLRSSLAFVVLTCWHGEWQLVTLASHDKRDTLYVALYQQAVSVPELHGVLDAETRDWTDGLLPCIFRDLNKPLPPGTARAAPRARPSATAKYTPHGTAHTSMRAAGCKSKACRMRELPPPAAAIIHACAG